MKTLIITIFIFFLSGLAFACDDEEGSRLRYNPMTDEFSYAPPQDRLKYNYMENEWSHESPDSHLRFNPIENRWEFVE